MLTQQSITQNQVIENYYCKIKMELSFPSGGQNNLPISPHSGFSMAGSDVRMFFREIITKEQNSSTANSRSGGPFTGVEQPNKTHTRSMSNSSLNVVMNWKDIQLNLLGKYWWTMNWFSCASLATLEMSSSLYVATEVKFMDRCYESTTKNTLLSSFVPFYMTDNGSVH